MTEVEIRKSERQRIAKHLETMGNAMLRDPTSGAIDGYVAAVLLDLSNTLEMFEDAPA